MKNYKWVQVVFISTVIALLGATVVLADSGEIWSPERLIPEDGRPVKSDLSIRGQGDDDVWSSVAFGRTPLFQDEDGSYLLFDGRGTISHLWSQNDTIYEGSTGLVYRTPLSPESAFGINGYVDFGDLEGFAGQGSLGFELEHLPDEAVGLRLGGNAYIPFEDYTKDGDRTRAPLLGADLYLGLARQWSAHRLEGFVTGFVYDGNSRVEELWGLLGEVEYRYEDVEILPEGSHVYARLGGRYDSKENGLSPVFGLGVSVSLNSNATSHDRVADVRRNIAFGSAFVPLDRKQVAAGPTGPDLGCGPGNAPFDFPMSTTIPVQDSSGSPYISPAGTRLINIVGRDAIVEACTVEFGGGEGAPVVVLVLQDCISYASGITDNGSGDPIRVNGGSTISIFKLSNSCTIDHESSSG